MSRLVRVDVDHFVSVQMIDEGTMVIESLYHHCSLINHLRYIHIRDMYLITTVLRSACNNNAFMFTVRKA